jgi:pseudo-rSAM protein
MKRKKEDKNKFCWLYLHPYVHISIKKNHAILYNTLNGKFLEYKDNIEIIKLARRLNSEKNLFVIKLTEKDINNNIAKFINNIRECYIGDLMDSSYSLKKPVQLKPMLHLEKTISELTASGKNNKILKKDEIKEYINIISLFINGQCDLNCLQCSGAYKQFPYCHKTNSSKNELDITDIIKLINKLKNSNLFKINILGGNILKYSKLIELLNLLNRAPVIKEYYIHYLNMEEKKEFFDLMKNENCLLNILINFPFKKEVMIQIMLFVDKYNIKKKFSILIEKDEDMVVAEDLISNFKAEEFNFYPYFNGKNLKFFEENVYLDKKSIMNSQPSMKDIFTRTSINNLSFKKLTILNNKDIYANLNDPKIGNLGRDYIFDLVDKELNRGKSWIKIRRNVNPCKSCIFSALCPPISNYEYAIGKYNLCDIWQ